MMPEEQKFALTIEVVSRLRSAGSWCGETNIQKTVYVLESMGLKSLDYDFILYKHGPFSFDLRGDITFMKSSGILKFEIKDENYGPAITLGSLAEIISDRNRAFVEKHKKYFDFVADWIGKSDIRKLEKLSTAIMVTIENTNKTIVERSEIFCKIKPHISMADAQWAFSNVDFKFSQAREFGLLAKG